MDWPVVVDTNVTEPNGRMRILCRLLKTTVSDLPAAVASMTMVTRVAQTLFLPRVLATVLLLPRWQPQ
jgi:hypothetical protein